MSAKQFRIGQLSNLGQVTRALGKTIRAMADGSLDRQLGASICNGLNHMRACFESHSTVASGQLPVPRPLKIVHEIVHVTETQEQIDSENDGQNLLVDYRETEAINGHGSNGGGSNGHDSNGSKPMPER